MLLMATAMGFASALTSGKALQSKGMRELFALAPDEQAVCFGQPGHRDKKQVVASAARARPLRELPFQRSMNQPIRMASLLATPAVGFEQPFEMLAACHERVNRMLALLERLREHLPGHWRR